MNEIVKGSATPLAQMCRELVADQTILRELTPIETEILKCTTGRPIAECSDMESVNRLKTLFKFIAKDVGYNIPSNAGDWQYTQTRIYDVIRKYYGDLTYNDIKMAFEMLIVGELDAYLPLDGSRTPDRKHYGQYNAEYYARILKAYRRMRNVVIGKAKDAEPRKEETIKTDNSYFVKKCRMAYLNYKYRGIVPTEHVMRIYEWLLLKGYAEGEEPSEADRTRAFNRYRRELTQAKANPWMRSVLHPMKGDYIVRQGKGAPEIQERAQTIAWQRAITKAFDYMESEGVLITL